MRSLPTAARRLVNVAALSTLAAVLLTAAGPASSAAGPAAHPVPVLATETTSAASPVPLCGYPLKKCPPGEHNPAQAVGLAPGFLLASQEDATKYEGNQYVLGPPWASGPTVVSTQSRFTAGFSVDSRNSLVLVSIVLPSGRSVPIGIVRTNTGGNGQLPTLRFSRPGITTVKLREQNGHVTTFKIKAV